jgi:hypothetical protein
MTRKLNIKTGLTGFAAALALAAGLFAAPDAMAGDRGDRWKGGSNHRIERHVDRHRAARRVERRRASRHVERNRALKRGRHDRRYARRAAPKRHVHRHVPRRPHRPVYVKRDDFPVGAVIAGIGLGIITHAIISDHYHD